jgi:ATP-dependent DNA ligase
LRHAGLHHAREGVSAVDLEGIVPKKVSSRYVSGRASAWLKVKSFTESEFVVVGYEPPSRGLLWLCWREKRTKDSAIQEAHS